MPPGGFLPDSWRDLIAITSLIGTLGTLAALFFAVVQVRRTRRIAEATQETMDTVLAQARSAVGQYAMSTGRRQLSEAKLFFDANNWSAAALRMGDLAEQAAQLAQSFSSDRQNWNDLGSMFRNWEATCRRLDRGTIQLNTNLAGKWDKFTQNAAARLDSQHGPFPAMRDANE